MKSLFKDVNQNLDILQEECAEVIQIIAKIKRFGLSDHHPKEGKTNQECLEQELGDVLAMVDIIFANKLVTRKGLQRAKSAKFNKLQHWYKF